MTGMAILKQRALEAQHLQEIEGNPFDAEDHAVFAAFERQGLSLDAQEEAVLADARKVAQMQGTAPVRHVPAAE